MSSQAGVSRASDNLHVTASTFTLPSTSAELKQALIEQNTPVNTIQEAADHLLRIQMKTSEPVEQYSVRFRRALTRSEETIKREVPMLSRWIAMTVSVWGITTRLDVQTLNHIGTPSVTFRQPFKKTRRLESVSSVVTIIPPCVVKKLLHNRRLIRNRDSPGLGLPATTPSRVVGRRNGDGLSYGASGMSWRMDHSTEQCFVRKGEEAAAANDSCSPQSKPIGDATQESETWLQRHMIG